MKQHLSLLTGCIRFSCATFGLLLSLSAYGQAAQPEDSTKAATAAGFVATGESFVLRSGDFNKGFVTSVEQQIVGRFAGLQVIPKSGAPGASYAMTAGHGNSFLRNNNPLLVVDGVLLDNLDVTPRTGMLSFLNPEDVASITFVRDAAALAAYGGKGVNGVLLIQTKSGKPKSKIRLQFSSSGAVSSLRRKADVLSGDEVRALLRQKYPNYSSLAGSHNTDWQDVICRDAYSVDNNLSISGAAGPVPFRISVGNLQQDGILKTSGRERGAYSLNLQPSFFDDHLSLNVSLQHTRQRLQVANPLAIRFALDFDPTQPVYAANGGYFGYGRNVAQFNPLALLEQREAEDQVQMWFGQARLRYKLHFLPGLSVNYRHAQHRMQSDYQIRIAPEATFHHFADYEIHESKVEQKFDEAFLTFGQELRGIQSRLDLTAGVLAIGPFIQNKKTTYQGEERQLHSTEGASFTNNTLDYYGQLHYKLRDRYYLNASFRHQPTSKSMTGTDPFKAKSKGISLGWDVKETSFFSERNWLTHLTVSASVGQFKRLDNENKFLLIYSSPGGYHPAIEAEKTTTYRLDLSYGILESRVSGSVSYYNNRSFNLTPEITGNRPNADRNAANLRTSGLEATVFYKALQQENVYLNLGLNAAWLSSKVLSLGESDLPLYYTDANRNSLVSETGSPMQRFVVSKQRYNQVGKPVEGYDRQNGRNGSYTAGSVKPTLLAGLQLDGGYGRWHISTLMRGHAGNQVFHYTAASRSYFHVSQNDSYLVNASRSYQETGFRYPHFTSDYFLEDASFVRMEYLQLLYDFGKVFQNKAHLKFNATAQNLFILTGYKGQDPEVYRGIDADMLTVPRTFSLGLQVGI